MVTEMRGLKKENAALVQEHDRARVVEEELRGEMQGLKKDKEAANTSGTIAAHTGARGTTAAAATVTRARR
eukprot:SAG22_NODE_1946_length_3279_cov_1.645283_3_plen_71_part_00